MRLFSYDKHFDVLYDNVLIWTSYDDFSYKINASPIIGDTADEYLMGIYSSEEKMQRELKRLHECYSLMNTAVFTFQEDEGFGWG